MKNLISVKDEKNLLKDTNSGAVLVKNEIYEAHKKRKIIEKNERDKINSMSMKIEELYSKINNVEGLILQLIAKKA